MSVELQHWPDLKFAYNETLLNPDLYFLLLEDEVVLHFACVLELDQQSFRARVRRVFVVAGQHTLRNFCFIGVERQQLLRVEDLDFLHCGVEDLHTDRP